MYISNTMTSSSAKDH